MRCMICLRGCALNCIPSFASSAKHLSLYKLESLSCYGGFNHTVQVCRARCSSLSNSYDDAYLLHRPVEQLRWRIPGAPSCRTVPMVHTCCTILCSSSDASYDCLFTTHSTYASKLLHRSHCTVFIAATSYGRLFALLMLVLKHVSPTHWLISSNYNICWS